MAGENQLLHIDVITVAGVAIPFEDGSGMLSGAAGFQNTAVASASGDHFVKRAKVVPTFKANIQFGPTVKPQDYSGMDNVQISARDTQSGRRVMMPKCSFGEMGDIGGGTVPITFIVLSPPQWL